MTIPDRPNAEEVALQLSDRLKDAIASARDYGAGPDLWTGDAPYSWDDDQALVNLGISFGAGGFTPLGIEIRAILEREQRG